MLNSTTMSSPQRKTRFGLGSLIRPSRNRGSTVDSATSSSSNNNNNNMNANKQDWKSAARERAEARRAAERVSKPMNNNNNNNNVVDDDDDANNKKKKKKKKKKDIATTDSVAKEEEKEEETNEEEKAEDALCRESAGNAFQARPTTQSRAVRSVSTHQRMIQEEQQRRRMEHLKHQEFEVTAPNGPLRQRDTTSTTTTTTTQQQQQQQQQHVIQEVEDETETEYSQRQEDNSFWRDRRAGVALATVDDSHNSCTSTDDNIVAEAMNHTKDESTYNNDDKNYDSVHDDDDDDDHDQDLEDLLRLFEFSMNTNNNNSNKKNNRRMEIAPGTYANLRPLQQVRDYVKRDEIIPCLCLACELAMFTVMDVQYVLCPQCRVVNPNIEYDPNHNNNNNNNNNNNQEQQEQQGVCGDIGLGFTFSELQRHQMEILKESQRGDGNTTTTTT